MDFRPDWLARVEREGRRRQAIALVALGTAAKDGTPRCKTSAMGPGGGRLALGSRLWPVWWQPRMCPPWELGTRMVVSSSGL